MANLASTGSVNMEGLLEASGSDQQDSLCAKTEPNNGILQALLDDSPTTTDQPRHTSIQYDIKVEPLEPSEHGNVSIEILEENIEPNDRKIFEQGDIKCEENSDSELTATEYILSDLKEPGQPDIEKVEPSCWKKNENYDYNVNTANTILYMDHDIKKELVIGPTETTNPKDANVIQMGSSKIQFICDYCMKSFSKKFGLRCHILRSHLYRGKRSVMPFKCELCPTTFRKESTKDKHMKKFCKLRVYIRKRKIKTEKKEKLVYQCEKCLKTFGKESARENHMKKACPMRPHRKIVKGETPFACLYCIKAYKTKNILTQHMREKHNHKKVYRCLECNVTFPNGNVLKSHMRKMHAVIEFFCDYCQKGFKQKVHLVGHIIAVHGTKPFKCDLCEYSFMSKYLMEKHKFNVHSGLKSPRKRRKKRRNRPLLQCDNCSKQFWNKPILTYHIKKRCSIPCPKGIHLPSYQCPICTRDFSTLWMFYRHKYSKHIRHLFSCQVCDDVFPEKYLLDRHEPQHLQEQFVCDYCLISVEERDDLVLHLHGHVGETPYLCVLCHETFTSKSFLTKHRFYHTVTTEFQEPNQKILEEPHPKSLQESQQKRLPSCEVCGKTFNKGSTLKNHMRQLHTTGEIWFCQECDLDYPTQKSLDNHINAKHRKHIRPTFACQHCDRHYRFKSDYDRHVLTHTRICPVCNKRFRKMKCLEAHVCVGPNSHGGTSAQGS